MQLNPRHVPSPAVNDRFSSCFHIPVGNDIAYESNFALHFYVPHKFSFSFYQILENEKLLLILVNKEKVFIYFDRLHAISAAIERDQPIKRLNRERLGHDVLFAFDETKRALAVCASKKVPQCLFTESGPHLRFLISCTFTCSSLMRPSRHSRGRGVLSTLPRGIAKQASPFCTWHSLVEKRRWFWWTPVREPASFPSSRCNLGEVF